MDKFKVAYISRSIYPDQAASALQMIQMAAAFSAQTGDTHFFVHDFTTSKKQILAQYNIVDAPLRIWRLCLKRWPSKIIQNGKLRSFFYNSAIAGILILNPKWKSTSQLKCVLVVRSRLEIFYWGLLRRYFLWLRNWIFVCEIHNLDLPQSSGHYDYNSSRAKRFARALSNYDLVLTSMEGLAKAIREMTSGQVEPEVIPHGTGLERLIASPVIKLKPKNILLGYIGTVDLLRGIDCILSAIRFLPVWIHLRIIGRIHKGDIQNKPGWLSELLDDPEITNRVELCTPVPYKDVAAEIDACDIVIQPAGKNIHASRYAAPLKLLDYMACGKPIVAAGVPSHLELLREKKNALIYKPGDPQDLARCVMELVKVPQLAQKIANNAWEQSVDYTYDARARRILGLVERVRSKR